MTAAQRTTHTHAHTHTNTDSDGGSRRQAHRVSLLHGVVFWAERRDRHSDRMHLDTKQSQKSDVWSAGTRKHTLTHRSIHKHTHTHPHTHTRALLVLVVAVGWLQFLRWQPDKNHGVPTTSPQAQCCPLVERRISQWIRLRRVNVIIEQCRFSVEQLYCNYSYNNYFYHYY